MKSQKLAGKQKESAQPKVDWCGFRAKWGTDSDGKWGAITTEVGRGFDGKWGTFGPSVVRVPHLLRNAAPPIS
jgi:hypothetical protein